MSERREVVESTLSREESAAVRRIADAAAGVDRVDALGEHTLLGLTGAARPTVRHVLSYQDLTLVGYGQLGLDGDAGAAGELVVHPQYRGRGHGRALLEAMIAATPAGGLRVWAHGDHEHARRLAIAVGFGRMRGLWQMRRPLADSLPEPELPAGTSVRPFRVGADEQGWLQVNEAAFGWHPEQGRVTLDDLLRREAEPWFDPAGFFLAESAGTDGSPRVTGFHWTKVHPRNGERTALGEVYVIGVHPDARGSGLGRTLSIIGLTHLRSRGLGEAMLYVEETNTGAIRLYTSLGFRHYDTDVMYRR